MWRFRVEEEAPFPDPPFIIAANHLSFLDPPLVAAAWGRRLRFITLADLFGNYPLLDFTLESFEAIRVKRGTVPLAAIRQSLAHLAEGGVVCLFPEGTRATKWGEVRPLPGAAWLAVKARVPIVAMAAIGTDRVLGIDNKLHQGTGRHQDRPVSLSARLGPGRGRRPDPPVVGLDRLRRRVRIGGDRLIGSATRPRPVGRASPDRPLGPGLFDKGGTQLHGMRGSPPGPETEVEDFDEDRESHREIDVALGNVQIPALGHEGHPDEQQEAEGQHLHSRVLIHEVADACGPTRA